MAIAKLARGDHQNVALAGKLPFFRQAECAGFAPVVPAAAAQGVGYNERQFGFGISPALLRRRIRQSVAFCRQNA